MDSKYFYNMLFFRRAFSCLPTWWADVIGIAVAAIDARVTDVAAALRHTVRLCCRGPASAVVPSIATGGGACKAWLTAIHSWAARQALGLGDNLGLVRKRAIRARVLRREASAGGVVVAADSDGRLTAT